MLGYFNFKGQKFEVGQEVEVQDRGHGVVKAETGKGLFHVCFHSGEEDSQVNIKVMKPLKKGTEDRESSVRSSTRSDVSEKKSQRSLFSRFSSKNASIDSKNSNQLTPTEETITELESGKLDSLKQGKRRGSGEAPRKDSKASLANTVSPRSSKKNPMSPSTATTDIDNNTPEVPEVVVVKKKKKPVRVRVLTDVEVRVIERIRKCHEQMNGDVFKSVLDLSLLQLTTLPSNCHELYYIRELNVRKNDFRSVYDAIFPFPHLTKLDLAYNRLLPADREEATSSAQSLDGSQVSELKDEIQNGTETLTPFAAFVTIPVKLTFLDLSGNHLAALPDELRILAKSLQILIIRKNKLTEFPSWFGEFKFLVRLDCADNDLVMSKALSRLVEEELPKLSDLNLDRNPCMKAVDEDQHDGLVNTADSLIGNKMRYLLQKRGLFQSKAARKVCVNRALDIKSRLVGAEKNKILADFLDSEDF